MILNTLHSIFDKFKLKVYLSLYLVMILFLGLNKKVENIENTALISPKNSIVLSYGSFAYTDFNERSRKIAFGAGGVVVEFEFQPYFKTARSENIIRLSLSSHHSDTFYIFQWHDRVIVSSGRDYDNSKGLPRVTTKIKLDKQLISIYLLDGSMRLYLNNELVDTKEDPRVNFAKNNRHITMKLGDYSSLSRGWEGEIFHLKIKPNYSFEQNPESILEYDFKYQKGSELNDISAFNNNLYLPVNPVFFDRDLLLFPSISFAFLASNFLDVVTNFFGFLPLGFLAMMLIINYIKDRILALLFSVCSGIAISFFIEYCQSWLPFRSSSSLDLMLNGLGALAGALLASVILWLFFSLNCKGRL